MKRPNGLSRRAVVGTGVSLAPAIIVAACAPGASEVPAASSTAPITISFGTDWLAGQRGDIMKQALELFKQKHPHITLQKNDITGEYFTQMTARFVSGTQDDVTIFDGVQFDHFRKLGKFVDLTPMLKAAKVDVNAFTKMDSVYTPDGKRYALPFQLTIGAWYVNKTLFKQEGLALPNENWTWNDMADAARKLTKVDSNQWGLGPALNTNLQVSVLPLILSNNGHHISADLKQTSIMASPSLEVIRWVADRHQRDRTWVPPGVAGVGFTNGNVAMAWGNTASIGSSTAGFVQSLADKFEWDVMPQPKSPTTGKSINTFNEQPYVITTKDKGTAARLDASFAVLQHLSGKDVQMLIAKQRGSTPILKDLVRTSPHMDAPPASMNVLVKSLDNMSDMRFFDGYLEWRDAYAKELIEVWSSKVSADVGAQKANDAGNAVRAGLNRK